MKIFTIILVLGIFISKSYAQESKPDTLTFLEFKSKKIKVVSSKFDESTGLWKFVGFKNEEPVIHNVRFSRFNVYNDQYFLKFRYPKVSVLTVPLKVRPSLSYQPFLSEEPDVMPSNAQFGLTNAYLGLGVINWGMNRYFSSGKVSSHYLSFGGLMGFSVEKLTGNNVNADFPYSELDQLFVSTGLQLTYSYNDISFIFVPAAWDFAVNRPGTNYIYNGTRWWGLGIGLSLKRMGMPYGRN
ncbi:hypothetical protein [Litoribacter populi]|uniref:hypothetical protein n=1 Tax=Litoribacter populi TaxID=2598460 RepID=UPI00117D0962|nr:hypothetical protein [Litoribacter populi]